VGCKTKNQTAPHRRPRRVSRHGVLVVAGAFGRWRNRHACWKPCPAEPRVAVVNSRDAGSGATAHIRHRRRVKWIGGNVFGRYRGFVITQT
jgi:hypothetical protein